MPGKLVQAWGEGLVAGRRGEGEALSPHARGTELAGHWHDGWRQGAAQAREVTASLPDGPGLRPASNED